MRELLTDSRPRLTVGHSPGPERTVGHGPGPERTVGHNPGPEDFLFLFFKNTASSRAAGTEFLQRLGQRTTDHDGPASLAVRDAQLTAWSEWGIPDKSKLVRLAALFRLHSVSRGGERDKPMQPVNG